MPLFLNFLTCFLFCRTVISNISSEELVEIMPEASVSRVTTETQTHASKAEDFEHVNTTNKTATEKPETETENAKDKTIAEKETDGGMDISTAGSLLSRVDIGAFDSMELTDDEDYKDCDDGSQSENKENKDDKKSPGKVGDLQERQSDSRPSPQSASRPEVSPKASVQSSKKTSSGTNKNSNARPNANVKSSSSKMADGSGSGFPSPTPSSGPDVSRMRGSTTEEGSPGHNDSMRSEALRMSMDFENDDDDDDDDDTRNKEEQHFLQSPTALSDHAVGDTSGYPKCSTRNSNELKVPVRVVKSLSELSSISFKSAVDDLKSANTSTVHTNTCSTDLGQYLGHSHDTLKSSSTTLPHVNDSATNEARETEDLTPVPEQAEDLTGTQKNKEGSTKHMEGKDEERNGENAQSSEATDKSGSRLIRRGSYTLEKPSPALVKSQCTADEDVSSRDNTLNSDGEADFATVKRKNAKSALAAGADDGPAHSESAASSDSRSFQLTSSMQDLNMKVVPRKLEFNEERKQKTRPEPSGDKSTSAPLNTKTLSPSEREGKQEHLAKYLATLSQVPGMKPHKRKGKTAASGLGISPGDTDPLEAGSTSSQRLSAKFTEQLLQQVQGREFEADSLSSSTCKPGASSGEFIQSSCSRILLHCLFATSEQIALTTHGRTFSVSKIIGLLRLVNRDELPSGLL